MKRRAARLADAHTFIFQAVTRAKHEAEAVLVRSWLDASKLDWRRARSAGATLSRQMEGEDAERAAQSIGSLHSCALGRRVVAKSSEVPTAVFIRTASLTAFG
jgi:hypothetical protein